VLLKVVKYTRGIHIHISWTTRCVFDSPSKTRGHAYDLA